MRLGRGGEQIVTELHGRYYEQTNRGNIFTAHAIVTAPVIYTTAAGTGGPLLYNPARADKKAVISAVGWGVSTVTTVAAILGLTGGPSTAPSATTAIDSVKNCYLGGSAPSHVGLSGRHGLGGRQLLASAPRSAHRRAHPSTGAMHWASIVGGMLIVPPGYFISFAASATASTTVGTFGMIWEEVPV
jgi:hypothetical protein